jgi:hypothetical protein
VTVWAGRGCFQAAVRYSLMSPAQVVCRWVPVAGSRPNSGDIGCCEDGVERVRDLSGSVSDQVSEPVTLPEPHHEAARRIFDTVDAASWWPRRSSSPWIRR